MVAKTVEDRYQMRSTILTSQGQGLGPPPPSVPHPLPVVDASLQIGFSLLNGSGTIYSLILLTFGLEGCSPDSFATSMSKIACYARDPPHN